MRILLVTEDFPQRSLGGLAKHVITLARALIKAGHTVDLLGNNQHSLEAAGKEREFDGQFFGKMHWHLAGWKEASLGVFLPSKRSWIAKNMAQCIMAHAEGYDVIHYHGHYPNIGKYIPAKINFVQTRHDQGADCLKHTRFRDGDVCNSLNPADCASCMTHHPNPIQQALSTLAVKNYRRDVIKSFQQHKVIFVSDMLRRNFIRTAGSGDWGKVVHNFVDIERFAAITPIETMPEPWLKGQLNVFVAGMLYPPKGIEAFLKILLPLMPSNLRLVIAGNGADEQRLRAIYSHTNINFLGWRSSSEVLQLTNAADVVVVPSIWEEPCATTVLEGLALGKPIYALDLGGTPELAVYERYPGQLRLFENLNELVMHLIQLKKTTQASYVYEEFAGDVSNCLNRILNIYQQ